MPALKHVHSYSRYRKHYYKCNDPMCTHFLDKKMVLGKMNKCVCGQEFILTYEDLRRATPKCKDCSNTKESRVYKAAKGVLDDLFMDTDPGDSGDKGGLF
jgi:hypothetical protein